MAQDGVESAQNNLGGGGQNDDFSATGNITLHIRLTVRSSMPFFRTKLLVPSMFSPSSKKE